MRQFYTFYSQVIDVSEEEKMAEIEAFIKKYHLDYKINSEIPKSKPIWEIFIIFAIVNTIIGIFYGFTSGWKIDDLLWGYAAIIIIYIMAYIAAKYEDHNIKVN